MRNRRALRIAFFGLLVLGASSIFLEDAAGSRLAPPPTRVPRGSIWSHRGLRDTPAEENTLASFDRARAAGFGGIELDVFHVPGRGLLVKHDPPFPPGTLRLDEVFARYGGNFEYWIDFKNLSEENVEAIARYFAGLSARDRVRVESKNAAALARLRDRSGVRALWWIENYPPGLRYVVLRNRVRWTVLRYGFSEVSAADALVGDAFLRDWRRRRLHIFTVNDPARIAALRRAGVWVILTDLEPSESVPILPSR